MDLMDGIMERRSIRSYRDEPVEDEMIEDILKAAMMAPSAGNEQPWQFIVIKNREIIQKIPSVHPYAKMVLDAPVAILVSGDMTLARHGEFWIQDCSAAVQNLLLAVHAKGLGSVWLGVFPREDRVVGLRKLLDLPNHIVPFALMPIGHPTQKPGTVDRFNQDRIHENGW